MIGEELSAALVRLSGREVRVKEVACGRHFVPDARLVVKERENPDGSVELTVAGVKLRVAEK